MGKEIIMQEAIDAIVNKISPREMVREFLKSGQNEVEIQFEDLGPNPQSIVNGMRVFITYHKLPVRIYQKHNIVYMEREV